MFSVSASHMASYKTGPKVLKCTYILYIRTYTVYMYIRTYTVYTYVRITEIVTNLHIVQRNSLSLLNIMILGGDQFQREVTILTCV